MKWEMKWNEIIMMIDEIMKDDRVELEIWDDGHGIWNGGRNVVLTSW